MINKWTELLGAIISRAIIFTVKCALGSWIFWQMYARVTGEM